MTLALLLVFALVAAACGGSADPAPTDAGAGEPTTTSADTDSADNLDSPDGSDDPDNPDATDTPDDSDASDAEDVSSQEADATESAPTAHTVLSEDGELGVSVPASEADTDVSIRLLESDEWPFEVAGGENVPGVKIYELEPDGASFDEPVTVTRTIDLSRFESMNLGPKDIPLLTMLTQNTDGEYELLDNLQLLRVGNTLLVTAETTHFSPIIISNENRMLPYFPEDGPQGPNASDAPIGDPPAVDDTVADAVGAAIERSLTIPPVVVDEERWLNGDELRAVIDDLVRQGLDEPRDQLTPDQIPFVPLDLETEPTAFDIEALLIDDPLGPMPETGPTNDDAGYRAQRFGAYYPAVPISWAPSALSLLGDPDVEFEMTVAVLELLVPRDVLDEVTDDVAEDAVSSWTFPTEIEFAYEVFHRIFGVYPSSVVKRYRNITLDDGLVAYTTTWEGEVGTDGRLVSIGELTPDGDDLVGESGIECFCEYLEAILVVSGGFDPGALDSLTAEQIFGVLDGTAYQDLLDQEAEDDAQLEAALALLTNPTDPDEFELRFEPTRLQIGPEEAETIELIVELLAVLPD